VRALVQGRVQGVGFRWFTRRSAEELGLSGSVRNRVDGSVEVEIQGPAAAVEKMIEALRRGPGAARVERLRTQTLEPIAGASRFEVRF